MQQLPRQHHASLARLSPISPVLWPACYLPIFSCRWVVLDYFTLGCKIPPPSPPTVWISNHPRTSPFAARLVFDKKCAPPPPSLKSVSSPVSAQLHTFFPSPSHHSLLLYLHGEKNHLVLEKHTHPPRLVPSLFPLFQSTAVERTYFHLFFRQRLYSTPQPAIDLAPLPLSSLPR